MSQRNPKTGVPHLVFQASTGFQYYLTFPKLYALNAKLPRQIRWSLGHDEGLARELASQLNAHFNKSFLHAKEYSVLQFGDDILVDLAFTHRRVTQAVQEAQRVWSDRPTPLALSQQDLSAAHARLVADSQQRPVLFTPTNGGEIHFALAPSDALINAMGIRFTRFDWPLGTRDPQAAQDAAVYIYAALDILESLPMTRFGDSQERRLHTVMSLYEYLCFARPDRGRDLMHMPPALPQSVAAAACHFRKHGSPLRRQTFCQSLTLLQQETGLYALSARLPDAVQQSPFSGLYSENGPITPRCHCQVQQVRNTNVPQYLKGYCTSVHNRG